MRRIKELRPSPAMAVAFVALFVAGAGGATAAKSLVTGKVIKDNSVTGKDVKNGSLLKKDFKRGQLPRGAQGPQGPQGLAGPAGRAGRDGFGTLTYEFAGTISEEGDQAFAMDADCPAGQYPTGGDAYAFDEVDPENPVLHPEMIEAQLYHLGADDRPQGWRVYVAANPGTVDIVVFVDVICANASPPAPQAVAKAKLRTDAVAGLRR